MPLTGAGVSEPEGVPWAWAPDPMKSRCCSLVLESGRGVGQRSLWVLKATNRRAGGRHVGCGFREPQKQLDLVLLPHACRRPPSPTTGHPNPGATLPQSLQTRVEDGGVGLEPRDSNSIPGSSCSPSGLSLLYFSS